MKYQVTDNNAPFGAALAIRRSFPTKSIDLPIGSSSSVTEVELDLDKKFDHVFVALNLGHRAQDDFSFERTAFGNQFFLRGGVGYLMNASQGLSMEWKSSRLYTFNEQEDAMASEVLLSGWKNTNALIVRGGIGLGIGAGIGTPSDATIAMEMGCDGVLINSAIAMSKKPILMAKAFKNAVIAGRQSFCAGRMKTNLFGIPSSPSKGLI